MRSRAALCLRSILYTLAGNWKQGDGGAMASAMIGKVCVTLGKDRDRTGIHSDRRGGHGSRGKQGGHQITS